MLDHRLWLEWSLLEGRLVPGWASRWTRTSICLRECLAEDPLLAGGMLSQKAQLGASCPELAQEEGLLSSFPKKHSRATGEDRGLAGSWAPLLTPQSFQFSIQLPP